MSLSGESDSGQQFRQLLESARRGSNESLGKVLDICRQYLLLVANRELDAQLQAKGGGSDLVQETFVEAQRDFGRFSGTTQDEMLAWLRQILLHNVQNFRRFWLDTDKRNAGVEIPIVENHSSQEMGPELPSPQQTPSQWAMKKERMAALDTALTRLPDEYRQVIIFRNQQHLSFEEISCKMGKSADAARKIWARAVEKLQDQLGKTDDSSSR